MSDIQSTLTERNKRYGDFTAHSEISEHLLSLLQFEDVTHISERISWAEMESFQRQALRVICDKLARIVNGDPGYDDNWRDISGYATLVLMRLDHSPE